MSRLGVRLVLANFSTAWSTGAAQRNKNCLVCLNAIRQSPKALLCATCPRVMHFACLKEKVAHGGHSTHCPLCVKRRWHLIRAVTPTQCDSHSADDFRMKRIRRFYRWHRYNCKHMEEWQKLQDDGSLESDRQLLINMGAAKIKVKQDPSLTAKPSSAAADSPVGESEEVAGSHINDAGNGPYPESQQQPADSAHAGRPQSGEAAEYYNPDASRLGSERASEAARSLSGSHPVGQGQRERAASAASSSVAPSARSSNRDTQSEKQAASSTSKLNSQVASSVSTSSSSSHASSEPRASMVSSGLRSKLDGASRVASGIASSFLRPKKSDSNVKSESSTRSTAPTTISVSSTGNKSATSLSSKTASKLSEGTNSHASASGVWSRAPSSRATLSQRAENKDESLVSHSEAGTSKVSSRGRSRSRKSGAPAG